MSKRPVGKWSMQYDSCVRCGGTDKRHMGKGLCATCYFIGYNAENADAVYRYKDKWYQNFKREGGLDLMKQKRELDNYDGLRELALARDGSKCVRCGSRDKLTVHHKDGLGRSVPREEKNNRLENLETLCRACHIKEHRPKLRAILKAKIAEWWCYKWRLQACRGCARSDRPHQSQGYCATCATRLKIRKPTETND